MLAYKRFSTLIAVETVEQFSITGSVSHVISHNAANMKNAFSGLPWFEHNRSKGEEEEEQAHGEDVMDTTGLPEYLPQHQAGTWRRCHQYNWTT